MGRTIVHENGWFFEWSTVVDAPVSEAMSRAAMRDWIIRRHGEGVGIEAADARLDRAEKNGVSALGDWISKDDIADYNRAGEDEAHLPWPEILKQVGIIA